jgi:hypothetical protein
MEVSLNSAIIERPVLEVPVVQKRPEIIEEVGSASTTGTLGILVLGNIPTIVSKIKLCTKINFAEGIGNGLMDLFQAPLKITISVISILKTLNYLPHIAIPIAAIATPILILSSAVYLLIEFIRTIQNLALSVQFGQKTNLSDALKQLDTLKDLQTDTALYLAENKQALIAHMGERAYYKLEQDLKVQNANDLIGQKRENIENFKEKIKAYITMHKVQNIYKTYVKGEGNDRFLGEKQANLENKDDHQYFRYLQKRIGQLAANEFAKDAEHIDTYSIEKLDLMDIESVKAFNQSATNLLSMVNMQRKKVLKVHIYSVVVLSLASLTLASSFIFVGPVLGMVATGVSIGASLFALGSGYANDAYINHTGKGFSARLMIPIWLTAKEGETNSSFWKTASTGKKVAFVIGNILVGLPLLYTRIAKSTWITKLRNGNDTFLADGNSFTSENSTFKTKEMTIGKYGETKAQVQEPSRSESSENRAVAELNLRSISPTSVTAPIEELNATEVAKVYEQEDAHLQFTGYPV